MKQLTVTLLITTLALITAHHAHAEDTEKDPDWHKNKKVEKVQVGKTPFTSKFGERVYFAGQPRPEDFAAYAAKGVKLVLNLRTKEEDRIEEAKVAKDAGLEYVNVGFGHGKELTADELNKILQTIDKAEDKPLLIHCASSNRVGYIWSIYRADRHGLSEDEAIAEGVAAGMKSPDLKEKALKEIRARKAKN